MLSIEDKLFETSNAIDMNLRRRLEDAQRRLLGKQEQTEQPPKTYGFSAEAGKQRLQDQHNMAEPDREDHAGEFLMGEHAESARAEQAARDAADARKDAGNLAA